MAEQTATEVVTDLDFVSVALGFAIVHRWDSDRCLGLEDRLVDRVNLLVVLEAHPIRPWSVHFA
jgi:hypothetical protein